MAATTSAGKPKLEFPDEETAEAEAWVALALLPLLLLVDLSWSDEMLEMGAARPSSIAPMTQGVPGSFTRASQRLESFSNWSDDRQKSYRIT